MTVGKQNRWIWPAVLGIAVVALVAIALNREPVQLDPNTPEGTVQAYLQAIGDSDYDAAFELLDPEEYEGCSPADLATSVNRGEPFTAVFDTENIEKVGNDTTLVPVRMQFGSTGPFGNGWTQWETFILTDRTGSWLITEEAWPYFVWSCREGDF
ncbi:MAG: hypothetical protein U9N56_03235 [Actinomycetota bacterium]|nr:hypothetical protein [Actinomycetota bacterium]